MNLHPLRAPLLLLLALSAVLSACKPAAKPVDFAPPPNETAAPAAKAASLAETPTELDPALRALAGTGGQCNLERVNGTTFGAAPVKVSKSEPVGIVGWIADTQTRTVPAYIEVRFINGDHVYASRVQTGDLRPDVQRLLGGGATFAKTGHSNEYDLSALPDGIYHVYTTFRRGGATFVCDNGRGIDLGP